MPATAPTRANGWPAVAMHVRTEADTFEPHGVMLLEVEGAEIAALHAFIDPALPPVFRLPAPA